MRDPMDIRDYSKMFMWLLYCCGVNMVVSLFDVIPYSFANGGQYVLELANILKSAYLIN